MNAHEHVERCEYCGALIEGEETFHADAECVGGVERFSCESES